MARRKKSLLATMLATPKRRARRTASVLFPVTPPKKKRTPAPKKPATTVGKPGSMIGTRVPAASTRPGGKGNWTESRFTSMAGSRGYSLYVPPGMRRTTPVPLMVMLHGCTQTPAEFAASTRFNQLADRQGVIVVYPHQTATHNLQRCWNWFEPRHQNRLMGEPAIIAGLVALLAGDRTRWNIDADRVYVAGISAGAGMALTLGATYPDVFAAVGVHSGPPYRSAAGGSNALAAMAGRTEMPDLADIPAGLTGMPPTIVVQGTSDFTVRAVNAGRVTDQWLAVQDAASGPLDPGRVVRSRVVTSTTGTRTSTVTRWYSARGRTVLESWLVSGLGHAWSGGLSKGSFSDPLGPRATTVMWKFLSAQRR